MTRRFFTNLFFVFFAAHGFAQSATIQLGKQIHLPHDSVTNNKLITALQGFLDQSVKENKDNRCVLPDDLLETSALLDEIRGMEYEGRDSTKRYRPYLTNVVVLDSANDLVQFSYLGVDNLFPFLRASFRLLAKKSNGTYYFASPLKRNTVGWQSRTDGDFMVCYRGQTEFSKIVTYEKKSAEFDAKLKVPASRTIIYLGDDLPEALSLLGCDYKSDYNGFPRTAFSAFENNTGLQLIGGNLADPAVLDLHDLWHDRRSRSIPAAVVNRPVDEGLAYLYGGSWGIPWPVLFSRFATFMKDNHDWLTAFDENKNFGPDDRTHLYVDYVLDALIAQDIEKTKGFASVVELVSCGKKEKDNANFFLALEKTSGITRTNFNDRLEKLVAKEKATQHL